MLKNIIFDIGNVLVDYRYKEMIADRGFSGEMVDRIAAACMENENWKEIDRGIWGREKLTDKFVEQCPELENEIRTVMASFEGLCTLRPESIDWIESFKKKGYKVYYLSNYSSEVRYEAPDALEFMSHMDGGVFSYEEHLIKPDAAIYNCILERYGLNANESVFIDDTAVNIEGAKAVGIHGIVFKSREQVNEEIEALENKLFNEDALASDEEEAASKAIPEKKWNSKRIVALVGVILLLALYLVTVILAFADSEMGHNFFRLSAAMTVFIPIMIWFYIWAYGKKTDKKTIASFHLGKKE